MADQPVQQQPAEGQQQPAQGEQKQERRFGGKERPQGGRGGPRRGNEEEWKPVTKLGRLVKSGKIPTLDDVFRLAIPIKEPQIVDFYLKEKLKEEVVQVKPVQKQTQAGQRTRFKAYVIIGDLEGHIGLGWKCHKEVQGAIKGAIESAKLNIVPVRKGYWGNPIGAPHTVPIKIHGKCGSVRCRLIPAPRGTGLVASPTSKRVLQFAGVQDVYTASSGSTKTKGNFARAVFQALKQTYHFLTPDFWGKPKEEEHPFDANSKFLHTKVEAPVKQDRGDRGDRGDRERRPFGGNRENRGGDRGGDRENRGGDRRGGEHRGGEQRGEPRGEPKAETRE